MGGWVGGWWVCEGVAGSNKTKTKSAQFWLNWELLYMVFVKTICLTIIAKCVLGGGGVGGGCSYIYVSHT